MRDKQLKSYAVNIQMFMNLNSLNNLLNLMCTQLMYLSKNDTVTVEIG